VGTASSETIVDILSPGQHSPFIIYVPNKIDLPKFSLRATAQPISRVGNAPQADLVKIRRYEDSAGFFHVAGVIENQSKSPLDHSRVVVTLYDRGGRVVNIGFAYPKPTSIAVGGRADFDVTFTYYPQVFSQEAFVIAE
jgi:hypothetical protein